MKTEEEIPRVACFGWMLVLIGLAVATCIGNGTELPRLAFVVPFIALGAPLCMIGSPRTGLCYFSGLVILGAYYFLWRGFSSPVWDLARRDILLVSFGALSFVSSREALRYRMGRTLLFVMLFILFVGHLVVSCFQLLDVEFSFLRGVRADQKGVSGFFYHRNYLAGFLEIAVPFLFAVTLVTKKKALRLSGSILLCLASLLCFVTNSRGGFVVMGIAMAIVFFVRRFQNPTDKKLGTGKFLMLIGSILSVVAVGWVLFSRIVENRGGIQASGSALEVRLKMAGVASEIWLNNPVFGAGAESYSYQFPKFFSGLSWYGDAQMAHSDFLQVLSDYGLVGLVFVLLLISSLGVNLLRKVDVEDGALSWLRLSAGGVLIGESIRSAFDFNLHLAPNLILFAIVLGGGVSLRGIDFEQKRQRTRRSLLLIWRVS